MANPEHLEILNQGVDAWNEWRLANMGVLPDLSNANLIDVDLSGANLTQVNLRRTRRRVANLSRANLSWSDLSNADLRQSNLVDAELFEADLRGARLRNANLKDAWLSDTKLQGTDFSYAIVDGGTLIAGPTKRDNRIAEVDKNTNFEGVGLDAMRIDPGIKQLLEYNIRRKKWKQWYRDENVPVKTGKWVFSNPRIKKATNIFLKYLVQKFWKISNYGLSTKRVIGRFFKWAAIFAAIYLFFEYITQGGIVSNLSQVDGQQVPWWLVPIRAFYFSVVTMTTLGFGDMYARFNSLLGHLLLTIQVLMGYMFLGALVTRFAVLFTAGGPAAEFTELKEEN